MSEVNIVSDSSSDDDETIYILSDSSSDDEETIYLLVDTSSDDEETIPTVNARCPSTPDSQCSICLDELTNPCHTDSCLHSFCFQCLQQWSNVKQFCPLCKETFSSIYHSFDGLGLHETYDVPRQLQANENHLHGDSLNEHILRNVRSTLSRLHRLLFSTNDIGQILYHSISETPISGQAMRIRVYTNNMWAEPLQEITGRIRDCSPTFYRNNPSHVYRLHLFILRDVFAIRESLRLYTHSTTYSVQDIATISNYIMRSLFICDIRQLYLLNALRAFLNVHLTHFCHELYNFANCIFDISEYDRNVQYTYRQRSAESTDRLPIETIVLDSDSDNEEVLSPITISDDSSSTDDSDDVLPNHSIEPLNSASIDQPSTSTEIRDWLNQPNNSLQSVDVGSSYLSHKKIGRPNLDSSSDDGDSIIAMPPSKAAHIKPLDNHNKKNKNKKIKINTSPGSKIPGTTRNRSYSESSSTSGETDAN